MENPQRETALYIVLEVDEAAPQRARAAASHPLVQSILLRPGPGASLEATTVKPLIEIIQSAGIAALVEDNARLARTVRADGVHVRWSETVVDDAAQARSILGTRGIVGAEAGTSRHDAMTLAEAGVDYVGFAVASTPDEAVSRQSRVDMVTWWAPIFEIPCVAFDIADDAEAGLIADLGADFVTLTLPRGETAERTVERIGLRGAAVTAADATQSGRR